jgi:heptose-I-phosphate ethanolaminephosphotransferase
MHSTKIIKRLAREEFEIPFWIWASEEYRRNHPDVWQEIRQASSRRYMTDALPHLLMYLGGIHCQYYNPELNILSPKYNEQRPRILKNQTDYDVLMAQ